MLVYIQTYTHVSCDKLTRSSTCTPFHSLYILLCTHVCMYVRMHINSLVLRLLAVEIPLAAACICYENAGNIPLYHMYVNPCVCICVCLHVCSACTVCTRAC